MGFKAYIGIIRPINCIFASITPLIGMFNSSRTELNSFFMNVSNYLIIFGGYFIYFFIAGASNVINDCYDIEIDKINKPNRPLPKEEISRKHALVYYWILNSVSISLSIIVGIFISKTLLIVSISIFFVLIGYFYAWKGKASGFIGNLLVGFSFASGIPFGALLIKSIFEISYEIWFFFFTSMFLLISRELVKGMEDIEGDVKFNIKTIANVRGPKVATLLSLVFSVSSIVTFLLPLFYLNFNIFLLIFSIFGVVSIIISIIILLEKYKQKRNQKFASLLLKVGAFFGLVAYITAFF